MDRLDLVRNLNEYAAFDDEEESMRQETIAFIMKHENCFDRELLIGHVTGSAWILSHKCTHVLLMHHRKLDQWFQPGGHCDGDPDVQAVAAKEAFEETGMTVISANGKIFDVDVHTIPAREGVPEHQHYDIRFVFFADMAQEELANNAEANAVRWIPLKQVHLFNNSQSVVRMVEKTVVRTEV